MMPLACDDIREASRLIHKRRVRLDPRYRGELVTMFENPKARMAYFGKRGLAIDDMGEALWEAGIFHQRPSERDVLELLDSLCTPGAVRTKVARSEIRSELADLQASLERELEVRRKNRWRVFECSCFKSSKIRVAADVLPPALARATCDNCGEPWTLRTIKLDLSNRSIPMTAEEVFQ